MKLMFLVLWRYKWLTFFSLLCLDIENVFCLIRASPQYEICYGLIYVELV
jgi:hypothetical protein